VLPRQTARALTRSKETPSLIGIADHFDDSLLAQFTREFEDLRSLDEDGLAATVEDLATSNGRVAAMTDANAGAFGLFARQISLGLLRDYLDAHPATVIIYGIRLSSADVTQVHALS
jgi:hypothetical protein